MNNVELTRLLLEQSKVQQLSQTELWDFIRLSPRNTGLPFTIFVDNGGSYKIRNHKLWAYVETDRGLVPITIEDNPVAMSLMRDSKVSFRLACDFIKKNKTLLTKLANDQIDDYAFYALLQKVYEKIERGDDLLLEMGTLKKEITQLPTIIWVDEDQTYLPHAPRIKFRADFQNNDTHNDPSMEIKHPERIHNLPPHCDLTNEDIAHLMVFVKKNEQALEDLANRVIDRETFIKNMIKVDYKGKEIEVKPQIQIDKAVNGIARCQKDGKYNFMNTEGDYLFDDFIFDDATEFASYINGEPMAYVTIGDKSYYINRNGEKEELV